MTAYTTPGIYIDELPDFRPSVTSVETAVPAFVGYTQMAMSDVENDLRNIPIRITTLPEYVNYFGGPDPEKECLTVAFSNSGTICTAEVDETKRSKFLMYYGLQLFFANGGGPCYIVSVNSYLATLGSIVLDQLLTGLEKIAEVDEVTLLVFPDAVNLATATQYYALYLAAIGQSATLTDRFVIMDVYHTRAHGSDWKLDIREFRQTMVASGDRKNAAAYFPKIYTQLSFSYRSLVSGLDQDEFVRVTGMPGIVTLSDLRESSSAQYFSAKNALGSLRMLLPASPAIAGIYARVDRTRGVWKAPANINIDYAEEPEYPVTNQEQDELHVDLQTGQSINVIRKFPGRGAAIVWGARTLDGNSNEWRYVSVRRFCMMVEESVKNFTRQFVFEPNDLNTWVKVKSMIQNYLTLQWRSGALMGATADKGFFVRVGLGETMTSLDILEGRMIIEIGVAVFLPSEFIVLRFLHPMPASL